MTQSGHGAPHLLRCRCVWRGLRCHSPHREARLKVLALLWLTIHFPRRMTAQYKLSIAAEPGGKDPLPGPNLLETRGFRCCRLSIRPHEIIFDELPLMFWQC